MYIYVVCIMYYMLCLSSGEKKNSVANKEKDFAGCCSKK